MLHRSAKPPAVGGRVSSVHPRAVRRSTTTIRQLLLANKTKDAQPAHGTAMIGRYLRPVLWLESPHSQQHEQLLGRNQPVGCAQVSRQETGEETPFDFASWGGRIHVRTSKTRSRIGENGRFRQGVFITLTLQSLRRPREGRERALMGLDKYESSGTAQSPGSEPCPRIVEKPTTRSTTSLYHDQI
jgi:hypothetical protein